MEKVFDLIDTHCHLYLEGFADDLDDVVRRTFDGVFPSVKGNSTGIPDGQFRVVAAVAPGIDVKTSRQVLDMARRWPALHPAIAIHPNYTAAAAPEDWAQIEQWSTLPEVVAIGETGLDLYRDYSPLETQIDYFIRHLRLAAARDLPVVVHSRQADAELYPVLRDLVAESNENALRLRGTIHSFAGDAETAARYLELGFYIGFTGSVTYSGKKNAALQEAARTVPDDRLLLETDSPFLVPSPFRGKLERNEPLMTAFVARHLAGLRETTAGEIIRLTARNARALFRLE